jgi:hypothetical protein
MTELRKLQLNKRDSLQIQLEKRYMFEFYPEGNPRKSVKPPSLLVEILCGPDYDEDNNAFEFEGIIVKNEEYYKKVRVRITDYCEYDLYQSEEEKLDLDCVYWCTMFDIDPKREYKNKDYADDDYFKKINIATVKKITEEDMSKQYAAMFAMKNAAAAAEN